jgi:hypothetical protein
MTMNKSPSSANVNNMFSVKSPDKTMQIVHLAKIWPAKKRTAWKINPSRNAARRVDLETLARVGMAM